MTHSRSGAEELWRTVTERDDPAAVSTVTLYELSPQAFGEEDLIISKIAWAEDSRSEVQERDVRNLMATGYDEDYLEHWLKELNLFHFAEDWLS